MDYDFRTFQFRRGLHATREEGMCLMEAVAYVAGEKHSDHPQCACPVIAAFVRVMNDNVPDATRAALLGDFVFRLVGTRGTRKTAQLHAYMFADFAVRVAAPYALRIAGKRELAVQVASLPPIVDECSARVDALAAALVAVHAAAPAAVHAAADAAADAARAAADVSYAVHAAIHAAYAAADAARAALHADAGLDVWQEAATLIDRMIRLAEPQEAGVTPAMATDMS